MNLSQANTKVVSKPNFKQSKPSKDTFVYKERKEREFKPVTTLPPEFYTSNRTGYCWCEACGGNRINVLNQSTLTCASGHKVLLGRSTAQTLKLEEQVNVDFIMLLI